MSNEKMRVLDLLDAGKITADEAAKLIESIGASYSFMSRDARDNVEEKLHSFTKEVTKFAKEVGCKVQDLYKEVEPKVKKASQNALEKCAAALDNLAHNVGESIEGNCCADEECCCDEEKEDKSN